MSDTNFYQTLGVGRSSSADEIRSAYRELVKKYHPDLFPSGRAKEAATEKLRQINEAYAVLGNGERRRRYDEELSRKENARAREKVAGARLKAPPPPVRAPSWRDKAAQVLSWRRHMTRKRAGYALGAVLAATALAYANRSEPKWVVEWMLVEKLELSSVKGGRSVEGGTQRWVPRGTHGSVSDCAAMLKEIVQADKREGSKAVIDERTGTMAITVHVNSETAPEGSGSPSGAAPDSLPRAGELPNSEQPRLEKPPADPMAKGLPEGKVVKRVRNLECRESRRVESETVLQRVLRSVGFP